MKLTLKDINNDLIAKEGYFEACYKLDEVENQDEITAAAEQNGLEIFFEVEYNYIRFTLQDN